MKTIKIATGVKRIELSSEDFTAIAKIRELLKEHRQVLIDRLVADLATYVNYQFEVRSTKEQLSHIKDRLINLRNSEISSIRYDTVINEILSQDIIYVTSEPFYFEINEILSNELHPSQLQLVK